MKILYAFPEPLPLPKARGIQTAWMVDALCEAGAQVVLAHCPSSGGHPLQVLASHSLPERLETLPLSRNWPFPLQRWHSVDCFVSRLLKCVDGISPDVVFVRHLKLAHRLLAARPDLPLVYEAHEVFSASVPSSKRDTLADREMEVLGRAMGVVYISGAVRKALHVAYPGVRARSEIILHSGVELPAALPGKPWEECGRHIVYAGSFYGWKGVDDLVAAAGSLPGCRITLLGGEAADLSRLQDRLPAQGAEVILLPRLPPEKVMDRLLEACIAVLPNRSEGVSQFTSPLKLFEYMAAGCAVVAADLPSIREVLNSGQAAWFVPGDSTSLATTLATLVANPSAARRQGEELRRLAAGYTWTARGRALLEFLRNTQAGRYTCVPDDAP